MSRLIIKGLPTRYGDQQLRDLFAFAGDVTDAKVIKTREGHSRQFGFVGFRTKAEANAAKLRLHRSYVDTAQVTVEFARSVGDDAIPRPWSKYSKGSSRHERDHGESEEDFRKAFLEREAKRNAERRELKEKNAGAELSEKDKVALAEFSDVVGKRGSKPIWADGILGALEKRVMVASRKKGGEGTLLERKHVTFDSRDSEDDEDDLYEEIPSEAIGKAHIESAAAETIEKGDAVAMNQEVSDMEYFKSKVVAGQNGDRVGGEADDSGSGQVDEIQSPVNDGLSGLEEEREPADEAEETGSSSADDSGTSDHAEPSAVPPFKGSGRSLNVENVDAGETGRLMVRNLAFVMTEEELETVFEPFGALSDVHIVRDSQNGKSRGLAFVQYLIPENAPKALVAVDGTFQNGRIIHVLPAKPRPVAMTGSFFDSQSTSKPGSSTFKMEREESQKDAARKGLDSSAQHAMHISSNAVADIMADRHGVSKAELYGTTRGESGIAAVRLAMAEATIQGEIRHFLHEHGVNLTVAAQANAEINAATTAGQRKRQSRTAFLVKNLPAKTKRSQLDEIFGRFGSIRRLIVVPSGILAVVEYASPPNAKRAFNGLAYTKFRETPLYLEWLPAEALKEIPQSGGSDKDDLLSDPLVQSDTKTPEAVEEIPVGSDMQSRASVYVKNLNFETRSDVLKTHFAKILRKYPSVASSLRSAKVAMKRGVGAKSSEQLSMGFGFLEFSTKAMAIEAVKLAQNSVLDGHTLQLRISNQQDDNSLRSQKRKKPGKSAAKASPKLIVRNIAFEATRRDLRQLFSAFGQLKTVRIPKKLDGSHRGFGFVEFVSKNEAKAAFDALASAHLFGRHLVIEYAEESEDISTSVGELQQRAAAQMAKKRIRTISGAVAPTPDMEKKEFSSDQQAMLEDELYA